MKIMIRDIAARNAARLAFNFLYLAKKKAALVFEGRRRCFVFLPF